MPLDLQTGVRLYQFVADRLDDQRRDQYPDGREEYETYWTTAHDLEKAFAEAVHAGESGTAERLLQHLRGMATAWQDHPHHPDNHTVGGSLPDDTAPDSQP